MFLNNIVVITDDSKGDRFLFRKVLEEVCGDERQLHYREADSGSGILETLKRMKVKEEYPTLLILDFILGDTNGLAIAKQLHGNYPPFPIVVMSGGSGCDDFDEVAELYRAGVSAFVYKPTDIDGYRQLMLSLKLIWLDQPKPKWASKERTCKLGLFRRRQED